MGANLPDGKRVDPVLDEEARQRLLGYGGVRRNSEETPEDPNQLNQPQWSLFHANPERLQSAKDARRKSLGYGNQVSSMLLFCWWAGE